MKCFKHNTTEAVAICACCGRALGHDCIQSSGGPWFVCSGECAEALSRDSQAIQTILQQAMRSAKASAFYCYLCRLIRRRCSCCLVYATVAVPDSLYCRLRCHFARIGHLV